MQHPSHLRPLALTLLIVSLLQVSLWQSQAEQMQASIFGDIHNWVFGSSSSLSVAPKPVVKPKPAAPAAPVSSVGPVVVTPPAPTVIIPYVPPIPVYFTVQGYRFPRTIRTGMAGDDVLNLQLILNRNPLTQMAKTGAESPGQETATYDYKTRIALIAFQKLNFLTDAQKVRLHREQGVAGLTTRQILEKLAKDLVAQGKLPSDTTNLHAAAQSAASSLRMARSSSSSRSYASIASQETVSSTMIQTSSITSQDSSVASTATSNTSAISSVTSVASTATSVASSVQSAASLSSVVTNPAGHVFYIDPVHGSKNGDGSAAQPWRTLQEVVDTKLFSGDNPTIGKIHAGDTVYLMSGNHGAAIFKTALVNTDYITIQAAPGEHPILDRIQMYNGAKWIIKGLTFRNDPVTNLATQLVRLTPVDDLIFTDNTMYSTLDASTWSPDDWDKHGSVGFMYTGNRAVISRNTIKNIRRGATLGGDQIEFSYNSIDVFVDDGLDYTSNHTVISHNIITNHYGKLESGNHNDGIQGWTINGTIIQSLVIDGNIVIESTGAYPWIPVIPGNGGPADYIQGISIFDGDWNNITVTNNVVVASISHGLSFSGIKNGLIANNTVLGQSVNTPFITALGVYNRKDGTPSSNVIIRNNIANTYGVAGGSVQDHNISLRDKPWNWDKLNMGPLITNVDPTTIFVNVDPTKGPYDFHLKAGSPAIGAGTSISAPTLDITGKVRDPANMDLGAYAK